MVEEEEGNVEKVCDGAMAAVSVVEGTVSLVEEHGGNGPDAGWQHVCAGVCAELISQAKVDAAQVVQAGVCGHHAGKDLCHVAQIAHGGALSNHRTGGWTPPNLLYSMVVYIVPQRDYIYWSWCKNDSFKSPSPHRYYNRPVQARGGSVGWS